MVAGSSRRFRIPCCSGTPSSGVILRRFAARDLQAVALSEDDKLLFGRDEAGKNLAWKLETGAAVAAEANRAADSDWRKLNPYAHAWTTDAEAEKFLTKMEIGPLVPGAPNEVMPTYDPGVYEVFSVKDGEVWDTLIDVEHHVRKLSFRASSPEEAGGAGCPAPGVAVHGRRLARATDQEFPAGEFVGASMYELNGDALRELWAFPCQDNRFVGAWMEHGRFNSSPALGRLRVWDPLHARLLRTKENGDVDQIDTLFRALYDSSGDKEASPNGAYRRREVYPHSVFSEIVEARSGKTVLAERDVHFDEDSLHVWRIGDTDGSSIAYWSLKTGRRLWTATEIEEDVARNKWKAFLIVEYPDGKFRLSKGAEKLVRIVDGFKVRPFAPADRARFRKP